jgi:rhodanese-related sulfurtransferase
MRRERCLQPIGGRRDERCLVTDQAKRVSPQEVSDMGQGVTVLDMRREWDRADTKIPGAIRVHPDAYADYVGSLPQGKPVVTYCT